MILIGLIVFFQIPQGDIVGSARVEPSAPRAGAAATLIVTLVNRTPGGRVPEELELPRDYADGPWALTPLEGTTPGVHAWRMVFSRPGVWDLPDIPIRYRAPGKPLRGSEPLLRFLDGPRVVVLPEEVLPVAPGGVPGITRFLFLGWCLIPLVWLGWRLFLRLSWPGTREAFRARLTALGLPPGRHLEQPMRQWWTDRGLPVRPLQNAIAGRSPWPDPRAVPTPWFWIAWLALGAL